MKMYIVRMSSKDFLSTTNPVPAKVYLLRLVHIFNFAMAGLEQYELVSFCGKRGARLYSLGSPEKQYEWLKNNR